MSLTPNKAAAKAAKRARKEARRAEMASRFPESVPIFMLPPGELPSPLPPGGVWEGLDLEGKPLEPTGPDGRQLWVVLPNGHVWCIDGRASNCTMPDDDEHRCWVRHGSPEDGTLTVDKAGHTCKAGAGSILAGNYHGFLEDGALVLQRKQKRAARPAGK